MGLHGSMAAILLVASGVAEQVEIGSDGGVVEPANAPQPISVTFWNRHTEPVTIKWEGPIGENGKSKMVPVIAELAVDARVSVNTFVGHTFISEEKGTRRYIHRLFVEHGNVTTIVCEREMEVKTRCVRHDYETPALIPGQISKVFAEIPTKFPEYQAEVLSSDPNILYFHNFTSDAEIEELIRVGGAEFKPSGEGGGLNKDGLLAASKSNSHMRRTSESSFCIFECNQNPTLQLITKRAAELVGVPERNVEYIQVLKYNEGQFYKTHHDNNPNYFHMPMGPRIYTLFLYLSDVEEGGETEFPSLGLRATPRKGAAVLWPSVSDSDPDRANDIRTMHQALPVIKGLKYAANIWIYMYDYKTQWQNACTG
jgi:hypothetical protein